MTLFVHAPQRRTVRRVFSAFFVGRGELVLRILNVNKFHEGFIPTAIVSKFYNMGLLTMNVSLIMFNVNFYQELLKT